ncbi:MAG TPA: hypothetical protein VN823_22950 [Stellaceae bacterium]|nr:hypothetical protein [Stellaceae bacterium]
MRDLAMFNLAIDTSLRSCDAVSLKVKDWAPHGHAIDRATVRQQKIGHAHSLRGTKAKLIYRRTGNPRAVQLRLGHTKIESLAT